MAKNQDDELLKKFVSEEETARMNSVEMQDENRKSQKILTQQNENYVDNGPKMPLGYMKIDVRSLPTMGLFYPDGIEILIRAARGEEIKHWSTINSDDAAEVSKTDDIINYIIERCVSVKNPGVVGGNAWKDLKGIDRFYLLLAVRDFTFTSGNNELMIPISEGKEVPVKKDMVDFIHIPDELMEYYSPDAEDRCFVFNLGGQKIKMHIPSIGVNMWLKNYAINKINRREGYDEDFMTFAPLLIKDWRNLTERSYENLVGSTLMWSAEEWSLVSYVMELLLKESEPKFKYIDDAGVEVQVPVSFRGGVKAIFTVSNPLRLLR